MCARLQRLLSQWQNAYVCVLEQPWLIRPPHAPSPISPSHTSLAAATDRLCDVPCLLAADQLPNGPVKLAGRGWGGQHHPQGANFGSNGILKFLSKLKQWLPPAHPGCAICRGHQNTCLQPFTGREIESPTQRSGGIPLTSAPDLAKCSTSAYRNAAPRLCKRLCYSTQNPQETNGC